ncbi:MAG: hypothetical protein K9I94_10570 [Bacteroidales bacterium]|nr:hypothetical protein [Bacteroidales bacterium]
MMIIKKYESNSRQKNLWLILGGGFIATGTMTLLGQLLSLSGFQTVDFGLHWAHLLGVPHWAGWVIHALTGFILAAAYVFYFALIWDNRPALKGLLYGLLLFIGSNLLFMPLSGLSFFLINEPNTLMMLGCGVLCHITYGITLGLVASSAETKNKFIIKHLGKDYLILF